MAYILSHYPFTINQDSNKTSHYFDMFYYIDLKFSNMPFRLTAKQIGNVNNVSLRCVNDICKRMVFKSQCTSIIVLFLLFFVYTHTHINIKPALVTQFNTLAKNTFKESC